MGGIIKFALKENNKIKAINLHTSFLLSQFGGLDSLFNNITMEYLENEEFEPSDNLDPTDYGVLFVDRDNKTILNVNSFCSIGKIGFARVKNEYAEYEELGQRSFNEKEYNINPNKEMSFVDPQTNPDSNTKSFYVIQDSLNVKNTDVILYGTHKESKEVEIIENLNFNDSIKMIKSILEQEHIFEESYRMVGIQFVNKDWTVINFPFEDDFTQNKFISDFKVLNNFFF